MKRYCAILFLLTTVIVAWAQPALFAEISNQHVGDLKFKEPKAVVFNICNVGDEALLIKDIHPSCGCVEVKFSHAPIMPKKTAKITAYYDAKMLGTFYRELAVYTNAQPDPYYLSFRGKVVTNVDEFTSDLPVEVGELRLSHNAVEFDDVNRGDHPFSELQISNLSHSTYTPQLMHLPSYLDAEYMPSSLLPGATGKIRLTLNSEKLMFDGLTQSSIYLARRPGDRVSEENEIVVSAVLLPSLHELSTSNLERAPYMVMMDGDSLVIDQVVMRTGGKTKGKVSTVMSVTNVGEEPLFFNTVQVWNRAVGVNLSSRTIAPHATEKFRVTLDLTQALKEKTEPRVLLICNDPRRPKVMLDIFVSEEAPAKQNIRQKVQKVYLWQKIKNCFKR